MRHVFGFQGELTNQEVDKINGGKLCNGRPPVTTMAFGEEGGSFDGGDPVTTLAFGEEGGSFDGGHPATTLAIGEEGGGCWGDPF